MTDIDGSWRIYHWQVIIDGVTDSEYPSGRHIGQKILRNVLTSPKTYETLKSVLSSAVAYCSEAKTVHLLFR